MAGWFALEDIKDEAGKFYVLSGSHKVDFDLTEDEKISNYLYVQRLKQYLKENKNLIHAPALQKGDVLFWNSATVHGSLPTLNPEFSRKSLTGHYLPSKFEFGKRYQIAPSKVNYAIYEGMRYRVIDDIYKKFSWKAKFKTDLSNYLEYHPKMKRLYLNLKHMLKK